MTTDNINLPKAPKDLCFLELDFIQDNFDVDTFLQDHRENTKLETMRDDLGVYLKLLRSAMIDLINRDYTDFVDLSSNIIGMDKAISDLQTPLGQLREEVMQVRQVLDDEISAMSIGLSESRKIKEYKQGLISLQHINTSVEKLASLLDKNAFFDSPVKIDILEQAAAKFQQLRFHLFRCKLPIVADKQKQVKWYEETYMQYLNEYLLACVHEKNSVLMIRCLRIYVTLDKIPEVESLVRKHVVGPLIRNVISVENLQTDLLGLDSIYNQLLGILNKEMKQLLDITLHPDRSTVTGFNFVVNSFWMEVEEQIEQRIKCIFAPGDPVLFHNRYTATLVFLEKLEAECVTAGSLRALQENPQYKSFLKKWNLPVYFQIRFQEIAGIVETALIEPISPASIKGTLESLIGVDFCLHASSIVWNNLQRIWSRDIYLNQLFQRFWKFTLQICARYQIWSKTALKEVWSVENEITSTSKTEYSMRLNCLVCLYKDLERFTTILPSLLRTVQSMLTETTPRVFKLLQESLGDTIKSFEGMLPEVTQEIIIELLKQCAGHLKQVSDIPRLFRRTNRDVPTKPCAYVRNSLSFLMSFHNDYKKVIPEDVNRWLQLSLSSLTEHYLTAVTDVLTSVQKTEESLRRLKKIRDKSTGSLSSEIQGTSDDEKIRIQLQVDVQAYTTIIKELDIPASNISHLEELLRAVETAVKK